MATDLSSLKWAGVPTLDASPLGNLLKTYRDSKMEGNRDRTLAQIDPNNPQGLNTIGAQLLKAGDVQGGLAVTQLARQNSNDDWQRTYQGGMLDVARQNASRQETPAQLQVLRAAGINPASPEGRKALFPRTDTPISATDKKAIFEAEDAVPQLKGTIEALDRAAALNDKTFSGFGAELFGKLGTGAAGALGNPNLASEQARATTEWSKIMGPQALETMASTLKGATTDFELRKFTEMLADPSTPADVRMNVIKRMKTLAERKMQLNESRIKDLRGGDYFKPGGGQPAAAAAPQAAPKQAPDGNFYVPDPDRPGKYLQVVQ
jgi:hypothetical protein